MRARHRTVLPTPPQLSGVVIDGSNVIATGDARALERLDLATDWFAAWRPDLAVQVFLDAATAWRLRPPVQEVLRARCHDVTPGRPRIAVCPRDESADPYVLEYANEHRALVVSNDRYFDFEDLRTGVILVQFRFRDRGFHPFEEATWFRPSGGAQRVLMTELQRPAAS